MSPSWQRTWVRVQGVTRYGRRRLTTGDAFIRSMLDTATPGRDEISALEREEALRTDMTLRRLGVRCLWRSAIVTDRLRSQGVAAYIGLAVRSAEPKQAHAECEVDGVPLRPFGSDSVRLR